MNIYSSIVNGDRLTDIAAFGPNPGNLRARCYIPAGLKRGAALVVVLHGCTQTAAGYDAGAGWSTLADRAGFALLFPEQVRANNPNNCFNWFQPGDVARMGGEAESIAGMVRWTVATHGLDPTQVFITGLSAGGAMTAAMLATWPELFAGGAIIGGLAHADAAGVPEAMARMRGQGGVDDAGLKAAVMGAVTGAGFAGRWPSVSIWHGGADGTVNVANMGRLGRQWRGVHGVGGAPEIVEGAGWRRRTWRTGGRVAVEEWLVDGMGHGVPIDPHGAEGLGRAGPHMLDVGVNGTRLIARGWGLVDDVACERPAPASRVAAPMPATPFAGVQDTIESALRSAGLMR